MGYEIDFIAVGDESKSGDAIAMRWGNLFGHRSESTIVVIDGGFKDSGEELVKHIKKYYKDDNDDEPTEIDLLISTHPDKDHISGLSVILDEFSVGELWLHQPWEHNENIAEKFKDGRVTDNSISDRLKEACNLAWELYKKAEDKGITINEPFQDKVFSENGGTLKILSPSLSFYEELLPDFDGLPETQQQATMAHAFSAIERAVKWVQELWGSETITDDEETSAKNNSSVISQFTYDSHRVLFTADAGIPALEKAAEVIEDTPLSLQLIQIPHHGSKHNIGPSVLNSLVGDIKNKGETINTNAYVSCAKKGEPKHPSKKVLNAFRRRGCKCFKTQGSNICHKHNAPDRQGWTTIEAIEFYDEVEE